MITMNEIINEFNKKNRELQNEFQNTAEYKAYKSNTDPKMNYKVWDDARMVQYHLAQKYNKELADYLISLTEFKDNSPYIGDMSVEVKGQKLVFDNHWHLNVGDVNQIYRAFLRKKNEENKESASFTIGDIYVSGHHLYRVKKVTEKSVMVDELKVKVTDTDFDLDAYTKYATDEKYFRLMSGMFYNPSSYYYWAPEDYEAKFMVVPTDEVEDTLKMTVVFEKGKTIMRNKARELDLSEKYNGEPITFTKDVSSHDTRYLEESIADAVKKLYEDCRKKADDMSKDYVKSEAGLKEIEELEKKVDKRLKECEKFNKEHEGTGITADLYGTSMDVGAFAQYLSEKSAS